MMVVRISFWVVVFGTEFFPTEISSSSSSKGANDDDDNGACDAARSTKPKRGSARFGWSTHRVALDTR